MTKDQTDWKRYDLAGSLKNNSHNMLELVIDTRDSVLQGSSGGYNLTSEVLNKYKLSFNYTYQKVQKVK